MVTQLAQLDQHVREGRRRLLAMILQAAAAASTPLLLLLLLGESLSVLLEKGAIESLLMGG